MSTFSGLFADIDFISVDRFESSNLKCSLFFLSHCHSDHMVGLNRNIILPGRLFCSEISTIFIKKQFPNLKDNLEILELEVSTTIYDSRNKENKVVVTAIPAHHCPGSVMFIFEANNKRLLYTGDFRYSKNILRKFQVLIDNKFDKLFIDSTFFSAKYHDFPTQFESLQIICGLTKSWTEKGPEYKIIMEYPAQYGVEYIIQKLYEKLNIITWIEKNQIEKFLYFPGMDKCISSNFETCSVFLKQKNYNISGLLLDNYKLRILKPTAIYWQRWNDNQPFHIHEGNEVYRIALSNHSSFNEIKNFIEVTKPSEVYFNVIPRSNLLKNKMNILLKQILTNDKHKECKVTEETYNFTKMKKNTACNAQKKDASILPPKRLKFK